MKNKNGITLIALVITIVVLIILTGVTINLTLGENGIIKRAEEAKQKDAENSAREKLELVLVDANIEKQTNSNYNKEEFLTQILEDNNITVEGNTVIVNNYVYTIDRENLVILESLGETIIKFTSTLQEYLGKNTNGKYEVSILLTVESNINMQSVVIENPDGTTFEIIPEGTKVAKDLTAELDETYNITATTKDGKTETRTIIEKSEENIRTVEELVAFRDKVNSGLTYEGKTINVVNNLDLSSVCGEDKGSWEPIGLGTTFKGIFDGKYKTISNLYINYNDSKTSIARGLFAYNYGKIKNLKIKEININVTNTNTNNGAVYVGVIVGMNYGEIANCGVENGTIIGSSLSTLQAGGVAGSLRSPGVISNCYNKVIINSTANSLNRTGGIVGQAYGKVTIENCYNVEDVTSSATRRTQVGGIVGMMYGTVSTEVPKILNSYNIGIISANGGSEQNVAGGIAGTNGEPSVKTGTITNTYCATTNSYSYSYGSGNSNHYTTYRVQLNTLKTYASTLGTAFTDDVQDEEGNYLNEGFPILKWQIEK